MNIGFISLDTWGCTMTTLVETQVLCWVNTSEDSSKSNIWLKPVESTPLVSQSVFVNLPNRSGQARFAQSIRDTFATHSYQIILDLGTVKVSAKGSMSISIDFASLGKALIVLEKSVEPDTIDPAEDSFFAGLPTATKSSAVISEDF